MLRQTSNILNNIRILRPMDITSSVETPTRYQCVRWKRKPMWLPVAKSKLFRVPARPNPPPEEKLEFKRLNDNYKTQIKSIRAYLREQVEQATVTTEDPLLQKENEEDWILCMRINDEWNAEVVKVREERLARQEEAMKETIMEKLVEAEEKEKQQLEEIEMLIKEEKERSKTYITQDNIDEAIEKALATEVDYNFAIDLDGNVFHGRRTIPSDVAPQDEKVQIPAQSGS